MYAYMLLTVLEPIFESCYLTQGGTHIIGKKNTAMSMCFQATALYSIVLAVG